MCTIQIQIQIIFFLPFPAGTIIYVPLKILIKLHTCKDFIDLVARFNFEILGKCVPSVFDREQSSSSCRFVFV